MTRARRSRSHASPRPGRCSAGRPARPETTRGRGPRPSKAASSSGAARAPPTCSASRPRWAFPTWPRPRAASSAGPKPEAGWRRPRRPTPAGSAGTRLATDALEACSVGRPAAARGACCEGSDTSRCPSRSRAPFRARRPAGPCAPRGARLSPAHFLRSAFCWASSASAAFLPSATFGPLPWSHSRSSLLVMKVSPVSDLSALRM